MFIGTVPRKAMVTKIEVSTAWDVMVEPLFLNQRFYSFAPLFFHIEW